MHPLADESYDASLLLGPLYHLQREEDRVRAVNELHRVTKKEGIVFVAFQSRIRMAINSLQFPQFWKPNDTIEAINTFYDNGIFNHRDCGRFTGAYYFHVDEIKPFMESHGFATLDLIGSSSINSLLSAEQRDAWEQQGHSQDFLNTLIKLAKEPSVFGISSHLLYIGKKK